EKFETRQGLFDVPTFITSIKDNKKLRGKTAFCIKIYVKLMDVGYRHISINLRIQNYPKTKKCTFCYKVTHNFVLEVLKNLA
ncbi:hypothetical protein OCF13_24190, partial [Bacillus tropicus]|uniref:hypothetical protein n=1 Tax=Bacillus tropicus TaxID=2026188 RepID=UPI0021D19396